VDEGLAGRGRPVDGETLLHSLVPSPLRPVEGWGRQRDGGSPLTRGDSGFSTIHSTYYCCSISI